MYQVASAWRGWGWEVLCGVVQSGCGCLGGPMNAEDALICFIHVGICDPNKSSIFARHFHTHVSVNPCNKGTELRCVIGISGFLFFALSVPPHLTSNATPPGESWFYMTTRPEGVWRVHVRLATLFWLIEWGRGERFVKKITRVKVPQFCFNCIDDAIYVKRCLCMEIWFVYI